MKIVIAGSSGFLGTALRRVLAEQGHEIVRLVRREPTAPDESRWDPSRGELDQAVIDQADVVVNVAGSKLLGIPYSPPFLRKLHDSRVVSTRVLADAIAHTPSPPVFLAQSASAWYGDHGAEPVTEQSDSRGDAFMTRVARDWEAATAPAEAAGSRVVRMRTVPVMERGSLTFDVLIPPFKLGLGARLGDGRQYFPVISLRDWVAAAAFLLHDETAAGPFNMCSPEASTNAVFTEVFASALGRKARLAVPAPLMRAAAGQLAPETLGSYRLQPAALETAGYHFQDRNVHEVIATALATPR